MFIRQYFEHFFNNRAENKETELCTLPISIFYKRPDYDDIKQEFRIAILRALRKWDRQMDLDKLVNDSVVHHMYAYFTETGKYDALKSYLEIDSAERAIELRRRGRRPTKK